MTILSLTPIPAFSGSRSIKGTPVRSSPLDYSAESLGGLQWPGMFDVRPKAENAHRQQCNRLPYLPSEP